MKRTPTHALPASLHRGAIFGLSLVTTLAITALTLNTTQAGTVLIPGSGTAGGGAAVVVGGNGNNANAFASGIFTGFNHTNNGVASAILTGIGNFITARNSYVGCGNGHVLAGTGASTILSGIGNAVGATGDSAAVIAGTGNTVGGANSVVAGGSGVTALANNSFSFGVNAGLLAGADGSIALADSNTFFSGVGNDTARAAGADLMMSGAGSDAFNAVFHGGYMFSTDNVLVNNPGGGIFNGLAVQNPGGVGTAARVGINRNVPTQALDVVGNAVVAGSVSITGTINLPPTTTATSGLINSDGNRFLHAFGSSNVFAGTNAGNFTMTGSRNTAIGNDTLSANTSGTQNTAVGDCALMSNTGGGDNTAIGNDAMANTTTGDSNTAVGEICLFDNTTGGDNTAVGRFALCQNQTGNNNTALGLSAGDAIVTGSFNIHIGHGVTGEAAAESNTIRIGDSNQSRAFVGGIRGATTGVADAVAVLIDSNGQLGTISSSRRYKEAITDMGDASERLRKLRPVTFRYKNAFVDGEKPVQFGLIAEEVAAVFPELAVRNADGEPETVKYHLLAPLLLNEVQKLEAGGEAKDNRIDALEARLAKLEKLLEQSAK